MSSTARRVASGALAALALVATLGTPGLAYGQNYLGQQVSAQPDAVILKDTTVIRGRIIEMKENSHVTVQLEGGQQARVRWDVIARIERQGAPPPPTTTTVPGQPPPTVAPYNPGAPAAVSAGTVAVHIDSPEEVRLEAVVGRDYRVVCSSPCDAQVPLDGTYRIAGSIRASKVFRFDGAKAGDTVVLQVNPSSRGGFVVGILLVSLGGVTLLVGSLIYLVGAADDAIRYDGSSVSRSSGSSAKTTGIITMLIGAGAIAGGTIMIVANGSSKVKQSVGGPAAPAAQPSTARLEEDSARPRDIFAAVPPPPFTIPLSFKF